MFSPKYIRNAEIYNENFNHFFTEKLNGMTPEQRAELPIEITNKIFRRGEVASAGFLNFNEKMYILSTVFQCSVTITVSDEANGLDIKDYTAALKVQRDTMSNGELLEKLKIKSAFVLGSKELMSSLLYMAHVENTGIYQLIKNYIPNADHEKNAKFMEGKKAFIKTLSFIKKYEANKQKISSDYGLTMPEWYALIYFSINEGLAKDFYNRDFTYAYNSNRRTLHAALISMCNHGYLVKRQFGKSHKYSASSKGLDLLNRIFNNILLRA